MPGNVQPDTNRYYGAVQQAKVSFVDRDQIDVRTANDSVLRSTHREMITGFPINSTCQSPQVKLLSGLWQKQDGNIEVMDNTKQVRFPYRKVPPDLDCHQYKCPAGQHTVKLRFVNTTGSGYMIEWIELTNVITAIDNTPQYRINNADPEIVVNKGIQIDFLTATDSRLIPSLDQRPGN